MSFPGSTFPELDNLRIGVFDKEADGFLEKVSQVFCGAVINARDKTDRILFGPEDIQKSLDHLGTFDVLVGQNIIGYDFPMLAKLFDWHPRPGVIILDTLWMSRMYHPDIEGGHSLGAWGKRLGNEKKEYYPITDPQQPLYDEAADPASNPKADKGWDDAVYTENMGLYCMQDVDVNVDLFHKLLELLANYSFRSIICEMQTAKIIQRQMQHGFVFNYKEAEMLHAELMERKNELEDEVHETFEPLPKIVREVQPRVKKDGTVSSVGLKKLVDWESLICVPEFTEELGGKSYDSGSFSLIEWPDFSLGSRQQIAERLVRGGFKLTKFTEKGNPIIDDGTLKDAVDAGIAEAKPLAEYFMITKREGMVADWLRRAEWHEDQGVHRIHGFVNSMGAITNRMTHNSPNVGQVVAPKSPYGKECRSLYTTRPGYKLVGCDASGLELRCLATYMKDPAYRDTVIHGSEEEGTDVHTINQKAAGLATRDQAKTFIYGYLYGAGDAKVGKIVGGSSKQGKLLKAKFLEKTPALKKLRENINNVTSHRKWLKGIDGRILRVRSPHAALNTLLQGAGAVMMKYWLVEVMRVVDERGIDANPVANIHDEANLEVKEEYAEEVAKIMEEAFTVVTEQLGLFCPLAGEAHVGETWYDVH